MVRTLNLHCQGSILGWRTKIPQATWWKWKSLSPDSLRSHLLYSPWNSPGQNTGVGSLSFLQGILPTQESNWGLPHCRQILYQLSYQESPGCIYPNSILVCIWKIRIFKCVHGSMIVKVKTQKWLLSHMRDHLHQWRCSHTMQNCSSSKEQGKWPARYHSFP